MKKNLNRRKIFAYHNKTIVYVISISLLFIFIFFIISQKSIFYYKSLDLIENFSNNFEYQFTALQIKGLEKVDDTYVREKLNKYLKTSIFLLPLDKIKNEIKDNLKFLNFSESQIFRKNSFNLNCERHHKIFNKINIIPNFCFSCYKIQIEPINVVELIKLLLIFDNIKLDNNNWRKCMVELRPNISGIYKGLIFCSSLKEAEKILDKITPILAKYLKYKLSIKRGCSEFYKSFPNFKITNQKSKDFMEYPKNWKKMELNENLDINNQKMPTSLSGLSISDVLIINQWLNYANLIGDQSFNEINLEFSHSMYIHKKMSHQTEFRRKEFLC